MMPNTVIQFAVQRLSCSECGAEANASCNCGKPYIPAKVRAAEAIKANPQKSDRAIAADIGVSHTTVQEARKSTGNNLPVDEPRIGLDGKTRKMLKPDKDAGPKNLRNAFLMNAAVSEMHAVYYGPVDADIVRACRQTANAWNKLVESLEKANS
jgi:hypothetical protein